MTAVTATLVASAVAARVAADAGRVDARQYWLGYRDAMLEVSGMSAVELADLLDRAEGGACEASEGDR